LPFFIAFNFLPFNRDFAWSATEKIEKPFPAFFAWSAPFPGAILSPCAPVQPYTL
jgi:hypothetical protein